VILRLGSVLLPSPVLFLVVQGTVVYAVLGAWGCLLAVVSRCTVLSLANGMLLALLGHCSGRWVMQEGGVNWLASLLKHRKRGKVRQVQWAFLVIESDGFGQVVAPLRPGGYCARVRCRT